MITIRLLWAEESERKIMMNVINAAKSAEIGATVLRNYELPKSNWEKTIPVIVKIIRENPELFAPLKKVAEELYLTQSLFLLSTAEEKLIENELEFSELKIDSLGWKKTREKLHNVCEKTTDYDIKRRELIKELHEKFYLTYYAVCNYDIGMNGRPWKVEDRLKIRKEFENNTAVTKLNRIIVNDLFFWGDELLLDKVTESGKLPREDRWYFPKPE